MEWLNTEFIHLTSVLFFFSRNLPILYYMFLLRVFIKFLEKGLKSFSEHISQDVHFVWGTEEYVMIELKKNQSTAMACIVSHKYTEQ